jgi:hypothetical protein
MHDTKRNPPARLHTLGEVSERMDLARLYKDPERFLTRQIKAGRVRAYKIGRNWMIADADIEAAIDATATAQIPQPEPTPAPEPTPTPAPVPHGMPTAASMRRRRVA